MKLQKLEMDLMQMMTMTSKNKMQIAKNVISKISIPEKNKIENAKSIFNFQIGKIIFQLKKE